MNAAIRKSKIKSILHYESLNKDMQEAMRINTSIIQSIIVELHEAFPFEPGNIIYYQQRVFKIDSLGNAGIGTDGELYFSVLGFYPRNREWETNISRLTIQFREIEDIKILS